MGCMHTLALKLIVIPTLIGVISLVGRRWGPGVSGWLVGLPLTSGPVALFLALDQGPAFAAHASLAILAGGISVAAFCLIYSWLASRFRWPLSVVASWLGFLGSTWALQYVTLPLIPLFVGVIAFLALALALFPRTTSHAESTPTPWWDIPARMLLATAFVVALTAVAPALGPRLSGLLAPFPIYVTILGVFTHHFQGAATTVRLLRGVVLGLFAFAAFFLVVGALVDRASVVVTFASATLVALAVQGASLWALNGRRPAKRGHVA
jgi:hypothetical protein